MSGMFARIRWRLVAWGLLVFGCLSRRAPSFAEWVAPRLALK